MDIKFISTAESENNEIDKMVSAVENQNGNEIIEIFDESGEGLEGFVFQ